MTTDPRQRLLSHVIKGQSCWAWRGYIDGQGYCQFKINGRVMGAHRAAYMLFIGPIPPGFQVDHACHSNDRSCPGGPGCLHRQCVNPAHLEAVTVQVNTARGRTTAAVNAAKTHCDNGHEFTPENIYRIPGERSTARNCRACNRDAVRRYKANLKARATNRGTA